MVVLLENKFQKKLTLLFSCGYKIGYQLKTQNLLTIAEAGGGGVGARWASAGKSAL